MADEQGPAFPADETIFVVTVPLQLVEGGSVNARYVAAAATAERAAQASAYEQWQKHYPDYLAGRPHVWKIRRRPLTKSGLFWGGVASGFAAFPCAIAAITLIVGFVQHTASAGEAGTAETTKIGSVHEHAVPKADAQMTVPPNHPRST
jgi:hypothetical protein